MALILLFAVLGELFAMSGAVDVKYQVHEQAARHTREDQEMEVQADGSAKAMMRREKGLSSETEAGDPVQTTTVFEEGVGTDTTSGSGSGDEEEEGEGEELLRTDRELQRTKSDPDSEDEGESDEEESDEETTTTASDDQSDDGSGLPEGESELATGSKNAVSEAKDEKQAIENVEESESEEEEKNEGSEGSEEHSDGNARVSSVEMEGFTADAIPHHKAASKAKVPRNAGHPSGHVPQSAKKRHQASSVKAAATPTGDKQPTEKSKAKVQSRPEQEAKSHKGHKMQRKPDSASLLSAQGQEADTTLTTTFYFTLVASNKYCANANSGYKKNVGNYQTKACFEYVLNEASCGKYFDFGVVDGACDCVPKVETNCNQADADNYHVYLIQKGGPEALIEIDDQGRASQEVIGDPADHGDPSDD